MIMVDHIYHIYMYILDHIIFSRLQEIMSITSVFHQRSAQMFVPNFTYIFYASFDGIKITTKPYSK